MEGQRCFVLHHDEATKVRITVDKRVRLTPRHVPPAHAAFLSAQRPRER
jgi:hypothetical protein